MFLRLPLDALRLISRKVPPPRPWHLRFQPDDGVQFTSQYMTSPSNPVKGFEHPETTKTWDALYYKEPLAVDYYDEAIRRTLDLLGASAGDKVLDAGCGAGVHAIRAARRGCQVDALDFSPAALEDAKARARQAGVGDRITFFQEDLTKLSFGDCSYDRIFSWGVLIHIPEMAKAMDELARILADGGKLALYVTNSQALQFARRRAEHGVIRRRAKWRRLPLGYATEAELHGEQIWVWLNDTAAIERHLAKHGLRLIARQAGEFSDFHLRFSGILGRLCWRMNNFWFRRRLPARLALMNLLVFEKHSAR